MSLNGGGDIGLGIELRADDQMSAVLDKANAAVTRLREGFQNLHETVHRTLSSFGRSSWGFGVSFFKEALKMAEAAAPFEAALHEVEFFGHATEEQMRDVNEAVFSSQNALMGFTATDAATSLKALAFESGDTQKALDQLSPALLYAGITSKSAEAGTKAMLQTMRSFPREGKDAGEVVDRLAQSSQLFHVRAGEMSDALGRVARGAQASGASMTDSAITLGLMRSGLPTVSMAAMQTQMAMQKMGDGSDKSAKKMQAAWKAAGIDMKDAQGAMKPLPVLLGELSEKTDANGKLSQKASDAAKALFGPRGMGGANAAIKDLNKGFTDAEGKIHKGADAVKYLYEQMQKSEGAAKRLLDAQLDTFAGQEKVLKASVESLKTGLGGPLAMALKPITRAVAEGLAEVVEFFGKMDAPSKTFIAQVTLIAGVIVSVLGAAFMVLGGPATAAVFALIAAGGALFEAYHENLGGFADWVHATMGRASLAIRALSSLFTRGGFDMKLFKELEADPSVENFAINIYVWVNRAREWFRGFVDGFGDAIKKYQPTLDAFSKAVANLAAKFGIVVGAVDPIANGDAFTKAGENGKSMGETFADIANAVLEAATAVTSITGHIVDMVKWFDKSVGVVNALKVVLAAGLVMAVVANPYAAIVVSLGLAIEMMAKWQEMNKSAAVAAGENAIAQAKWQGAHKGITIEAWGKMVREEEAAARALGPGMEISKATAARNVAAKTGVTLSDEEIAQMAKAGTAKGHDLGLIGPEAPPVGTPVPGAPPVTAPTPEGSPAAAEAGKPASPEAAEVAKAATDMAKAFAGKAVSVTSNITLQVDGEVLAHVVEAHKTDHNDGRGVPTHP